MGNLAVKCEDEWKSRKINVRCVGGKLDVRVMRTDGTEADEFDRPVVAAEVMYRFPDYAVVQWCPLRNTKLGKRGQLRVLQRHDILSPGPIYFLFPIPIEVLRHAADGNRRRSRRMQSTKDRLSRLLTRSEMAADGSMQQPLRGEKSGEDGTSDLEGRAPSSEGTAAGESKTGSELPNMSSGADEEGASGNEEGTASWEPRAFFHGINRSWRPALVSIPESPVGFHSRSESPMTPIAFRLVSLKEGDSFEGGSSPVLL